MKSLVVSILLLFSSVTVQATDWTTEKQKHGITVETRVVPGEGVKEFRGSMNVSTRLSALVGLMEDIDRAPEWMHDSKSLRLDEFVTERDRWLYLINGAPWPLRTRDAYVHVVTTQDTASKTISIDISAHPDRKPKTERMVRISRMRGGWHFEPKPDKTVDVIYEMFVDPGGSVPKALANIVVVDNPYNTLRGMQRLLATGDYDDVVIDWVVEP